MRSPDDRTRGPHARSTVPEVETVLAWHEALNAGDTERLISLSHPEIEVGGPRGSGKGTGLLREWVERAGIRLRPLGVFQSGSFIIVEQEAEWRSTDTGQSSAAQRVASVFVVGDGLVGRVTRHGDLREALDVSGLDRSNEV